jgi:hypothetical protein
MMRTTRAAVLAAVFLLGATLAASAQAPSQPYPYPYSYSQTTPPAPAPSAAAPPQWDYSRLGPTTDTPRYDYPGPALIGGMGGGGGGGM